MDKIAIIGENFGGDDPIKVTQSDRDAAADWLSKGGIINERSAAKLRETGDGTHDVVAAFAQHRQRTFDLSDADKYRAALMLANKRQGRIDTPRCEPPGEYEVNLARSHIDDVLAVLASVGS